MPKPHDQLFPRFTARCTPNRTSGGESGPNGRAAAERLIRYVMLVNESIEPKDIGGALAPAIGNSGEEIAMTVGHRLIDQGHKKGLAEGIEKGRAEGIEKGRVEGIEKGRVEGRVEGQVEGKREALENLLRFKFGPPSDAVIAQIHSLDRAQLDACMIRIFGADSPSAVFESPST